MSTTHHVIAHQEVTLSTLLKTGEMSWVVPAGNHIMVVDDSHMFAENVSGTFVVERDAQLAYRACVRDTKISHVKSLTFVCAGEGASVIVRCVYEGRGDAVHDLTTKQIHQAPHTKSDVVIKSVLRDNSTLRCTNLIRIEKQAQHSSASEQNKNIVIGDRAQVVTIPKLEVEAHDVSATHGAAVSRVSEADLLYLQMRGITHHQAQEMIIAGFLQS